MAKVYFTNLMTRPQMGLMKKLKLLLDRAGMDSVIEKNKMTAIKLHFGEYGNLAYLRPNYVRTVVDMIKDLGGIPFVTDANTLYKGSRSNAIDHTRTAYLNGFAPETIGAPVIIADGLRGSDEVKVRINEEYVKEAKIGSAIALADNIVVMTHFKGHEQTGFGGTIKNLGMGCASRAGKLEQHSSSKPVVNESNCIACRMCEKNCPTEAIKVNGVAAIDYDVCIGCGQCIAMCNYGAMVPEWDSSTELLSKKMAEYAKATLIDKKALFVSFITNVSPDCDCWSINKPPISPDIGIAVSTDPVALDRACIDLVIKAVGHDPFVEAHPDVTWKTQLEYAEKIGLGRMEYESVEVAVFK